LNLLSVQLYILECLTRHYFLTTHPNNHLSAPMASTCCGRSFSYALAFSPKPTNTEIPRFVVVHLSHRLSRTTSTKGFRFSLTDSAHFTRETQLFLSNFLKGFPFSLRNTTHAPQPRRKNLPHMQLAKSW